MNAEQKMLIVISNYFRMPKIDQKEEEYAVY